MAEIKAGININFPQKDRFQPTILDIIEYFAKQWYVTHGIPSMPLAKSDYSAIWMKPTEQFQQMFNIEREVIVVFSTYEKFQPRSIDALDHIRKTHQALRFEEICSVIISKDENIESEIRNYLKSNQESQIIIPFTFKEFKKKVDDPNFITNRFRKYFYARDLFAFESALQKDLYFFGRRDIIYTLLNRHLAHENSGIFGLRKTGKTSILYSIQRALSVKGGKSVAIDCQDTAVYKKRWNQVLFLIIRELYKAYNLKLKSTEEHYSVDKASEYFSNDISAAYRELGENTILIIFDEVERITFDVSEAPHWRSGEDFIDFWRTIRSNFQRLKTVFTYIIASTNPKAVETATINESENPIALQTQNFYIEQFTISDTKEMINKLGNYMGLRFQDDIPTYLTRDYGGHPFLMRHVCSVIHTLSHGERPKNIDRIIYDKAKTIFENEATKGQTYSEMILSVLDKFYPDEYYMLTRLAIGDYDTFQYFAEESPAYTNHLIGYGILSKNEYGQYDFKIDTLKRYLLSSLKFQRLNLSNEERQAEISKRRNNLEPKLRKIVMRQLKVKFGETDAKEKVLSIHPPDKRRKYSSLEYKELFDANKCEIYWEQVRTLMMKYWEDCFRNIFDTDATKFDARMTIINELRKADAHAAQVSDADLESFRGAVSWLEERVEDF